MANRQDIRERRRKRKQQQRIMTLLVVVGSVFILAATLMMPTIRDAITPLEFIQPPLNPRPMADANTMGDPNAPVKLEIFSDFGCGHCGTFAQTTGELLTEQYVATGQVYMVYNSVGFLLGNPISTETAEAAYCAGDQGMFWEYHDMLYANQVSLFSNVNRKLDKTLMAYADALGMDSEEFEACIDSNKYNNEIQQDQNEAQQAEISSTPSFLINGTLLVGNKPLNEFQVLIETELAKAGQ